MYKILLLVLSLFMFCPKAYAFELSLDDALQYALERNEDVKVAELAIEQSRYIVREVKSAIYPSVNLTGQYIIHHTYSNPYVKSPFIFQGSTHGFNLGVGVEANQILFTFGMLENAIDAAEIAQELMLTQKELAQKSLRYSIRNAYFAALVYEENYRIALQSYQNALSTKEKLESSASVRMSQSDLIKVDADIASRKPMVDSSKLVLEQSYRLLEALCVLDEPITKLTTKFSELTIIDYELGSALELVPHSSTLQLLSKQVEYNTKLAEAKRDTDNPTLALRASYSFGNNSQNMNLSEPSLSGEGLLGVFLNVPLYDGGKAKAQGRQEDINVKINKNKYIQTQRLLENQLISSYETYMTSIEILKMDDDAIKLASRAYEMSLSRFLNGQASAVELNDVESGLTQLKMKRISTVHSIYSSLAQIEQIVGEINEK